MKCPKCGTPGFSGKRQSYQYRESGLDNVTLLNIEVRRCGSCGEEEAVIPGIDELHRTIAHLLSRKPGRLLGREIRFLRSYLGHSSKDFAAIIGSAPESLSRWEHDKTQMPRSAEQLLRVLVFNQKPQEHYPEELLVPSARPIPARAVKMRVKPGRAQQWAAA